MTPSADLLVFVHIEKCAGTAVNTWLSSSHRLGKLYVKASSIPMTSLRWSEVRPIDLEDLRMRSVASHHLRTYPDAARPHAAVFHAAARTDRALDFLRALFLVRRTA